jgi:hypothetical protein
MGCLARVVCRCRKPIVSGILGRNRWPMIPGVMNLTVAPEPFVEWVAGADHLTVCIIGSHVVL